MPNEKIELTTDQKEIMGRATYNFICRLREERPEVWQMVKARAAENAARNAASRTA